jgi:DNA-binding NarL/FixJ family response regulator
MMNNLILASACQNRLASWKLGLNGFTNTALVIDKLGTLRDDVVQVKPKVLLLDFDLLGSNGASSLRNICTETKTIIIGSAISEDMEWELLKAGVRGCCQSDISPNFLRQVVEAVQQGELWIRRTLTCRLIDELGKTTAKNKAYRTSLGLLNKLTQREYDIAVRVGNGESNKQIAQSCGITERTVKAHLTEVFQKLGVTDRLNLALVISADDRNTDIGYSDSPLSYGSRYNDIKSNIGIST